MEPPIVKKIKLSRDKAVKVGGPIVLGQRRNNQHKD